MGVRAVEGARLERVYTAMYRRFESSRFRQEVKMTRQGYFCFYKKRGFEPRFAWSEATSPHPLASRRYEKRPARVFFISSKKKRGFEPKNTAFAVF